MELSPHFITPAPGRPDESMVIRGDKWRIQVLTERLMRIEWSPSGIFEDRATQMVINRAFPPVAEVRVERLPLIPSDAEATVGELAANDPSARDSFSEQIMVSTPCMTLHYNGEEFSSHGLYATVLMSEEWGNEWRWEVDNERPWIKGQNLRGTCRTLDDVNGRIPLENGVCDGRGITALQDTSAPLGASDIPTTNDALTDNNAQISISVLGFDAIKTAGNTQNSNATQTPITQISGWPTAREAGSLDVYIFAGGWDFQETIRDYYRLTGAQPVIPRWALGNWWSRYHRYSAEEYVDLMDRFAAQRIPLSVAVVDMDWHLVDIPAEYGSGWTGFTWNRELFPDPPAFLAALHERGLHTALNLHPADGIRAFEECYQRLATALNHPADGTSIPFAPDDPQFMQAYFDHVLHPLEEQGVDMWWPDWQQGSFTRTPGIDPLWVLNHMHVADNARHNGRGLTLSRYAGPGSHRYPVGFSGDTTVSWESLAFQPEFTATASNIGYGWWSHDIGGHMFGVNDRELQTRWVQFGVFSPLMRLHSSNNPLMSKEPWRWGMREGVIQAEFMRLRHRLVPYLHSEQVWGHRQLCPLIVPMYWVHADRDETWNVPNQYYFGRQLIVAPVTVPEDRDSGLARVDVFVPEGVWVDLLTGRSYEGCRTVAMYRPLEQIPVLGGQGSIVPLAGITSHDEASVVSYVGESSSPMVGVGNPSEYEVLVVAGADGGYDMVEDAGDESSRFVTTRFIWNDAKRILSVAVIGEGVDCVPAQRKLRVRVFEGNSQVSIIDVELNIELLINEPLLISIPEPDGGVEVQARAWVWEIAERAQIENKQRAAIAALDVTRPLHALSQVEQMTLPDSVRGALVEALTASALPMVCPKNVKD